MISKDFFSALKDLETQKGINGEVFLAALETALTSAYKRNYGEAKNAKVKINPEKATIKIYSYKTVVESEEMVEDPDKQISLAAAKAIKSSYKVDDQVEQEENPNPRHLRYLSGARAGRSGHCNCIQARKIKRFLDKENTK